MFFSIILASIEACAFLFYSQVNVDDDHHYHPSHQDNSSYTDEVLPVQYQFPEEALVTVNDLETDPFLGLQDDEPDSWTPTVSKEIVRKLKEKEIKRQEHLYEFILTEKHHCLTLRVMQKVFVEGLKKYLNLGATVDRMFPRINDLVELHLAFLHKLRTRQKDNPVIDNIGNILLEQFGGPAGAALKSVYGEFCSNHRNAIDIYKYYMQSDTRFAEFVKHCQANPLLKKKGIPECILFVTQRLTKYPLLIEPLIKTMKDNKDEQEKLVKALTLVKEILVEVDAQVAEKEKEDRKLEIYNRVEAKSFTTHKGLKFKKSDILDEKRKLRFEGIAMLMQGRGKMQVVLVIVFSDVLCFLLENNHKYSFFTPENKAGVVSLQKLLVREKAGQESRGIYLISSNPAEPEMFELKVHKPKDKQVWIKAIRTAVQECPDDDDYSGNLLSNEERQKQFDTKQRHLRELVELLRQKDKEEALVLEEKLALQLKLLAAAGIENLPERPNYMNLVSSTLDSTRIRQDVHLAVKRVNQLARSLYASAGCVSRSSSSVGEHQSEMFIIPSLPKRAETFGGFDNQVPNTRVLVQKKQPSPSTGESPLESPEPHNLQSQSLLSANNSASMRSLFEDEDVCPTLLTEQDHQLAATQLAHHVYTLSCIIYHQITSIDSLEAEVAILKSHSGDIGKPAYRHNHQLEELRNLQDKLQSERELWQREKESEMKELQQKRDEIAKLQEQVKHDQVDLVQQRSQLFRKLDVLSSRGVIVNSTLSVSSSSSSDDPSCLPTAPSTDPPKKKNDPSKWKPPTNGKVASLPLNLISATNQQKVSPGVQVRQQLPLKLASKLGGSCGSSPASPSSSLQQLLPLKLREDASEAKKPTADSPTQLTAHLRTGSSPAMMQNIPVSDEE
ncbi:RHO guanyl-nucleotide exchange factor [Nesidiocoris tenuis]|uniref:RHO guanyl-nucleotide exchange factor n=1 Tax=Nesidiocoris tenuis TaxID=355587 RepID=A0ABN7AIT3_9HEMI|nr:RHO guanyl-nucleotide exchange factor [Nesidiocoris tenuis]